MTGYQQAILMLLGVDTCGKFLVRCVDRWYIDAVAELFQTAPYLQHRADGKRDFWTVKSAQVSSHFPAGPKKLQFQRTQTGETCVLYYQSPAEVADILDSLHGEPCNRELWARWDALMQQNNPAG